MTETLFGNTIPALTNNTDASPGLTLGTRIHFNAAGQITGLRWYFPDVLPAAPVQYFLWTYNPATDGIISQLATGTFSAPVVSSYNTVALGPFSVAAGDEIVAAIFTGDRYVTTPHLFDNQLVNGDLVGPADEVVAPNRRNGRFHGPDAVPTFPTNGFQANSYHVDVTFEPGGAAPLIVQSLPGAVRAFGPVSHATLLPGGSLSLQDKPGAVRAFGPREVVTTRDIEVDPMFMPAMTGMLSCLIQELALTPKGVPKHARITPGDAVIASLTNTVNECCDGIASVRLVRFFPTDQFPQESVRPASEGGVTSWAVELELQVVRCTSSPGKSMNPSDAALTAGAGMMADDWAAMRRAACCQYEVGADGVQDFLIGAGVPTSAEGGCIGGTLAVTLQLDCAECAGNATW